MHDIFVNHVTAAAGVADIYIYVIYNIYPAGRRFKM